MSELERREQGLFKKILFCTDFSENADFAYEFAIAEALRTPQSILYLLHIIPEPEAQFWKTYIYEVEDIDRKAKQDIDNKLAQSYFPRTPENVDLRVEMRIGKDYIKILDFAQEAKVDLIIIGRHGQTAFGKILFGNVTEKVARKADCPVLIIPLSYEKQMEQNQVKDGHGTRKN